MTSGDRNCQSIKNCRSGRRSCRVCRTKRSSARRKNMGKWAEENGQLKILIENSHAQMENDGHKNLGGILPVSYHDQDGAYQWNELMARRPHSPINLNYKKLEWLDDLAFLPHQVGQAHLSVIEFPNIWTQ